jgi:hypothetical protein
VKALLVPRPKKQRVKFIIAPDRAADMDNPISYPSALSVGEKPAALVATAKPS